MSSFFRVIILISAICPLVHLCSAQDSGSISPHYCLAKLLKGSWQLSQTYSLEAYHAVAKEDYNEVIQFRAFHHYRQEVFYESNHWILEGKWKVDRKKKLLALTKRHYILSGAPGAPADIFLHFFILTKKKWAAGTVDKGARVAFYYNRVRL